MVPITQMVSNGFSFDVIGATLIVIGISVMVAVLGIGGWNGDVSRRLRRSAVSRCSHGLHPAYSVLGRQRAPTAE